MSIRILKDNNLNDIKGVHLFHHPASNNAFRARLILEEKNISWESHIIPLNKFEQFSSEFLNINPQGSVPVMIHDGVTICGSENILKYVETVFSRDSLSPYPDKEKMWDWVEAVTRTHISSIVGYLYSKGFGRPARKDMLHFYKKYNPEKYTFLVEKGYHMTTQDVEETYLINQLQMQRLNDVLETNTYIMGDMISVADMAWIPNAIFLEYLGFNLSDYPNVQSWMQRMKKRNSFNKRSHMPNYSNIMVKLYFKALLLGPSYLK